MGNVAIRAEGLGKLYRIGGKQERYRTLRDTLSDAFTAPFKRARNLLRGQAYGAAGLQETIWALKDVSFEVKHGEVVGIIGRNGAGKSTLLKVLSRITEPTEGYADVYGRVGSLLEVGTGFHPELTGRENIYLNGAILGMGRKEIDRKFDEIVDFAEVEKFVDTPVKHYSSGMYLRLAFAVAAHLEPEILLVDEVLAVGDAQFQKKCLGKMGEIAGEGRTVLFVSHNMAAVQSLCSNGLVLVKGKIIFGGASEEAISVYMQMSIDETKGGANLLNRVDRQGGETFRFREVALLNEQGKPVDSLPSGAPAKFLIRCQSLDDRPLTNVSISIRVDDMMGQHLFTLATFLTGQDFETLPSEATLVCKIPSLPLVADIYSVFLWASVNGYTADIVPNALQFSVSEADIYGSGKFPIKRKHGSLILPHDWAHLS